MAHHVEIQDGPEVHDRRVVLDGNDITVMLSSYTVHREGGMGSPRLVLQVNQGVVRGSLQVDDERLLVTADFPDVLKDLLARAGYRYGGVQPLAVLADRSALINEINGWYATDRPFTADIGLLHSEVSEAFEAWRKGRTEEINDAGEYDPSSLPAELADVLIRLLDTSSRLGIDLDAAAERKLEYNRNRTDVPARDGGKRV